MMNDQILSSLFLKLVVKEGFFVTGIDGITLTCVDHNMPPLAVLQEPTLVFDLQVSLKPNSILGFFLSKI